MWDMHQLSLSSNVEVLISRFLQSVDFSVNFVLIHFRYLCIIGYVWNMFSRSFRYEILSLTKEAGNQTCINLARIR